MDIYITIGLMDANDCIFYDEKLVYSFQEEKQWDTEEIVAHLQGDFIPSAIQKMLISYAKEHPSHATQILSFAKFSLLFEIGEEKISTMVHLQK